MFVLLSSKIKNFFKTKLFLGVVVLSRIGIPGIIMGLVDTMFRFCLLAQDTHPTTFEPIYYYI